MSVACPGTSRFLCSFFAASGPVRLRKTGGYLCVPLGFANHVLDPGPAPPFGAHGAWQAIHPPAVFRNICLRPLKARRARNLKATHQRRRGAASATKCPWLYVVRCP